MKTHTRACTNTKPCNLEHTYFCKYCGEEFTTDESTHFRTAAGITVPIEAWPYCSASCEWSDKSDDAVRIEAELPAHVNESEPIPYIPTQE